MWFKMDDFTQYTTFQKFKMCFNNIYNFFKEFSYAYQGCIYLIKNTLKSVILWKINTN